MAPALRKRTVTAATAAPPAEAAELKKKAAAPRPHSSAIQMRWPRRAALLLALAAAALALATTLPAWRAAYDRASADVASLRAEALKKLMEGKPGGGDGGDLAPPPKRAFVEPTGGSVPADPANPTEAEVKAALGELGQEALPKVPAGPSGFVTEAEWAAGEAAGEDDLRPRLRAAVLGAFVADAATVGVHG